MAKNLSPEDDPTSIGNILIEMGLINEGELAILVTEFKKSEDVLLGEFLVQKNKLSESQMQLALMKQNARRNGRITHSAVINACKMAIKSDENIITKTEEIVSLTKALVAKS